MLKLTYKDKKKKTLHKIKPGALELRGNNVTLCTTLRSQHNVRSLVFAFPVFLAFIKIPHLLNII